ncbi:MAG: hypothetical protein CMF23_08605 [Ignavibacteriae bacterium]|nr:hypothetical protein [Ignavibacteriota bacterium]|tara:strand:- start:587 stop:916 length:330 start_codon:yes stop_codon:yes gene_type:complete
MLEKILNIYLIINNGFVTEFKAKSYERDGDDETKIEFLKARAKIDFETSESFEAPISKDGEFMSYRKFSKLERRGMQYKLFEEIFSHYDVPENPLICVTPIEDGNILAN